MNKIPNIHVLSVAANGCIINGKNVTNNYVKNMLNNTAEKIW